MKLLIKESIHIGPKNGVPKGIQPLRSTVKAIYRNITVFVSFQNHPITKRMYQFLISPILIKRYGNNKYTFCLIQFM